MAKKYIQVAIVGHGPQSQLVGLVEYLGGRSGPVPGSHRRSGPLEALVIVTGIFNVSYEKPIETMSRMTMSFSASIYNA